MMQRLFRGGPNDAAPSPSTPSPPSATAPYQRPSTASSTSGPTRPIQFLHADQHGKFVMDPEAVAILQLMKEPIGIVSVYGRARQGKSFILTQCCLGTSLWSAPLKRITLDGTEYNLILSDSEGIDAYDQIEGPAKAKVLDTVMNIYIKTLTDDDDKEVVAQACIGITEIVNAFGFVAAEPYMSQLIEAVLVLLKEESACQLVESDGEVDEDDAEHDEILMDAVSDLLPAFAKYMGPHFAPVFSKWFGPFMKFSKASRPPQDRTMVVASLAEVAQNMGALIAGYIETLMPLVLKELAASSHFSYQYAELGVGISCDPEISDDESDGAMDVVETEEAEDVEEADDMEDVVILCSRLFHLIDALWQLPNFGCS